MSKTSSFCFGCNIPSHFYVLFVRHTQSFLVRHHRIKLYLEVFFDLTIGAAPGTVGGDSLMPVQADLVVTRPLLRGDPPPLPIAKQ